MIVTTLPQRGGQQTSRCRACGAGGAFAGGVPGHGLNFNMQIGWAPDIAATMGY